VFLAPSLAILLAAALVWISIFMYWHVRIASAIRAIESKTDASWPPPAEYRDAERFLSDADCRAIPQMIEAIEAFKNPEAAGLFSKLIVSRTAEIDHPIGNPEDYHAWQVAIGVYPDSLPSARRQKIVNIRAWWKQHRARHPWWRIWSSKCSDR
jgi:hypothetical protein